MERLVLVDHYDSFTFNVIGWLSAAGFDVRRIAFDDAAAMAALLAAPEPFVLSPGPRAPADAPQSLALVRNLQGTVPILGVCLGHQLLAAAAGAAIRRGRAPFHGATRQIRVGPDVGASPLAAALPPAFAAATYNSLVIDAATLPAPWRVLATCAEEGEVQMIAWEPPGRAPAYGVQFHPESFLSERQEALAAAWLGIVSAWRAAKAAQSSAKAPLSTPS
jgi:anthranilate synthase component 2